MPVVVSVTHSANEVALGKAVEIATKSGQRLVVVLHRPAESFTQAQIDEQIDELNTKLDVEDLAFRVEVRMNEPELASALYNVATEQEATLVVVGIGENTGQAKPTLGYQIQRLLLESPCPVLVVRPDAR